MSYSDNLDEILDRWNKCKQEASILNKRMDAYKQKIKNIMDKENTNKLTSNRYVVSRKNQKRESMSKKTVPHDVWKSIQ